MGTVEVEQLLREHSLSPLIETIAFPVQMHLKDTFLSALFLVTTRFSAVIRFSLSLFWGFPPPLLILK